jgi:hypothetical protein
MDKALIVVYTYPVSTGLLCCLGNRGKANSLERNISGFAYQVLTISHAAALRIVRLTAIGADYMDRAHKPRPDELQHSNQRNVNNHLAATTPAGYFFFAEMFGYHTHVSVTSLRSLSY